MLHQSGFLGREVELKTLADAIIGVPCCQEENDELIVVISGPGGIGKSALANEFYNRYQRDFDGSCRLRGDQDFAEEMARAGESMHLPNWPDTLLGQIERTIAELKNHPQRLVILDNMNDIPIALDWISRLRPTCAIILTRLESPDQIPHNLQLKVDPLSESETLSLLRSILPFDSSIEAADCHWLFDILKYHPYLWNLARYLFHDGSSKSMGYLLKKRWDSDHQPSRSNFRLADGSILDWKVSDEWTAFSFLSDLLFTDRRVMLRDLFIACGYFAPGYALNTEVLSRAFKIDSSTCQDMLDELVRFGLLEDDSNGPMISNRMADCARWKASLEKVDILQKVIGAWEGLLNGRKDSAEALTNNYSDIAHLKTALFSAITGGIQNTGFMMFFLGRYYQHKKAFPLAEICLKMACEMDRNWYGFNHLKVGIIFNALGNLLDQEQKYLEAGGCYANALSILVQHLDPDHPLLLMLRNYLDRLHDYLAYG